MGKKEKIELEEKINTYSVVRLSHEEFERRFEKNKKGK